MKSTEGFRFGGVRILRGGKSIERRGTLVSVLKTRDLGSVLYISHVLYTSCVFLAVEVSPVIFSVICKQSRYHWT